MSSINSISYRSYTFVQRISIARRTLLVVSPDKCKVHKLMKGEGNGEAEIGESISAQHIRLAFSSYAKRNRRCDP